jgi:hypothetical protein
METYPTEKRSVKELNWADLNRILKVGLNEISKLRYPCLLFVTISFRLWTGGRKYLKKYNT